jgi:CRP/FNR family transcriptional regulator, cyclic AMP receptor protein
MLGRDAKTTLLETVPLFARCSKRELAQISRIADEIDLRKGFTLCREGQPGREFIVLLEGEAEVARGGQPINTLAGGDFVGEIALLEDTPRTATVTTKTPVRLFVLTRQDFRKLVDENRSVEQKVMRALARRVVELSGDPTVA